LQTPQKNTVNEGGGLKHFFGGLRGRLERGGHNHRQATEGPLGIGGKKKEEARGKGERREKGSPVDKKREQLDDGSGPPGGECFTECLYPSKWAQKKQPLEEDVEAKGEVFPWLGERDCGEKVSFRVDRTQGQDFI